MEIKIVDVEMVKDSQLILGHAGFIKTPEDLYEAMMNAVPNVKFGLAFVEASGNCLIMSEGNDDALKRLAQKNARKIGAGHTFVILFKNAFPINITPVVSKVPEVVNIYCATANPVQVLVAETKQGRSIVGVVDGSSAKGLESKSDRQKRKKFLRDIKYKL